MQTRSQSSASHGKTTDKILTGGNELKEESTNGENDLSGNEETGNQSGVHQGEPRVPLQDQDEDDNPDDENTTAVDKSAIEQEKEENANHLNDDVDATSVNQPNKNNRTATLTLLPLIIMTTGISTLISTVVFGGLFYWHQLKVGKETADLQNQVRYLNKQIVRLSFIGQNKTDTPPVQIIYDVSDTCPVREVDFLRKELLSTNKQLEICIKNTTALNNSMTSFIESVDANMNQMKDETWKNTTDFRNATMGYILNNFLSYEQWLPIIGTGLIVEFIIAVGVFWMCTRWSRGDSDREQQDQRRLENRGQGGARVNPRHKEHNGVTPATHNTVKGMNWVLMRMKERQLEDRVCVLSFHQGTINRHTDMIKSVMQMVQATANFEISPVVINEHEDVLGLPLCNTFVMVVDYNQRNVILEDPKRILGDLKLTTAKSIQKLTADLILMYAGDRGSEHLGETDICNKHIISAQQHPDLQALNNKERFLSFYKELSEHQKEHISQILLKNLL